jgi:hypothetical protein
MRSGNSRLKGQFSFPDGVRDSHHHLQLIANLQKRFDGIPEKSDMA